MAKQDTCKHSLEVEAGRHLMGEAASPRAEWAEMEGRAAWGHGAVWARVNMKKGVESEKGQGCLGSCKKK